MSSDIIPANYRLGPAIELDDEQELAEDRDSRVGWGVIIAFFVLFLGFAAFVRLDAAAYAEGTVSVAGNRQAVQHRDGGVVAALHVKDGERVKEGQVLIELVGAEVAANERALAAQVIGLQAERARLLAERAGAASITRPVEFATLSEEDRKLADAAMQLESSTLVTRRRAISAQKNVLAQQSAQLNERISGLREQLVANRTQDRLFDEQLEGMKVLVDKGYASINRVRELERAQAGVMSDRANLAATAAAAREQIGETRMQAVALDSQSLEEVAAALRRNEESLGEALPRWRALQRQLEQTKIRAPATGQVVGLKVFTVGGVIAPGDKLMEIVPEAVPLVIEARFDPNDADDVYVGQIAEVRFATLHERDLPVFEGEVTRFSADSFTDERTGIQYYTGEVVVPAEDIERVKDIKGGDGGIKPGLPAQILVPLRQRTMLQYLLQPLNQVVWRSGREH